MNADGGISRRSFSIAALSAGLALPFDKMTPLSMSAGSNPTWPSFQGDARNSGHTENQGPQDSAAIEWSVKIDERLWSSPAIYDDILCVPGSEGTVYGIDTGTGDQLWTHSESRRIQVTPAVFDDAFVVPLQFSNESRLAALDPTTGDSRWELRFEEGAPNAPTVLGDSLFVSLTDGRIASYAAGGTRHWDVDVEPRIWTTPAAAGNTVVVGSFEGVHAFDVNSGEQLWTYPIKTVPTQRPGSSPTIVDDTVIYCGGHQDQTRIVGLDLHDGTEVFSYPTEERLSASPAVTDDRLVVGTSKHLLALDWRTGTEVWRRHYYDLKTNADVDPIGTAAMSSPVISGGTVYVGTGTEQGDTLGSVYGLSLDDGRTKWQVDVTEWVLSSPAIASGTLYVGDHGGTLYAISEENNSNVTELGLVGGALAALGGGAYAAWRRWGRESDPGGS